MNAVFRTNRRTPRSQRGASLLEVIAYLGIAAIVVLGAVSLLNSAFASAQSNRTLEEVVSIRTGVKRLYMGQASNYGTTEITTQMIAAGIMPATLSSSSTGAQNVWNGAVIIKGATTKFTISYANVPSAACIAVLSGATGWSSVATGNATPISTFPITPAAAQTACDAGNANTITWTAS